ncbi:hypothetical protein [Streptomyces sp. TLI_171]|uniref:hypothetical protein n=1 Tax=Streptomyces sp. TLI_171 TaxID=1938859 RepID=UPI000C407503|nr:hypothetical protein [Streptomyces sp. TLI_171]RKE18753.1 hypothetical protein BX266_2047 [Streptomyces sp. TLI_171]
MRTGIRTALRRAEHLLLIRGARRNAWAAVCENRRLAGEREHSGPGFGRSA